MTIIFDYSYCSVEPQNAATVGRLVVLRGQFGFGPFWSKVNLVKYHLIPPGGDTESAYPPSLDLYSQDVKPYVSFL